jgi:hypothetical protein
MVLCSQFRSCPWKYETVSDFSIFQRITSMELIENPDSACIVRANGGSLVRLIATVVAIQENETVILDSDKICSACTRDLGFTSTEAIFIF